MSMKYHMSICFCYGLINSWIKIKAEVYWKKSEQRAGAEQYLFNVFRKAGACVMSPSDGASGLNRLHKVIMLLYSRLYARRLGMV